MCNDGADEKTSPTRSILGALKSVERLVRVSDKGQTHLGLLLFRHGASLSTVLSRGIFLRDFVDREIRDVDVGSEAWLERSSDLAKLIPDNAAEEGVAFNLVCASDLAAVLADTMFGVAEEAKKQVGCKLL